MVDRPEKPEPTGDGRLAAVTVPAVIVVPAVAGVAVGVWWSLRANAEEVRRVQAANLREMSVVIAGRPYRGQGRLALRRGDRRRGCSVSAPRESGSCPEVTAHPWLRES
ncbi:hypothetical protein ACFFV7_22520 [Nonomuraea spiralis]|uniref:Uncharacterized protein n=1 Tax=Nonomuraea spiralis TaxID=46182 RepID=A0ABV5IJS0_9ACTN|nr:hypothetical protein [Nonomuraea spiralis]GGS94395.1 hypothetical protein GCM10010176_042810 [Nonomuraea spiralis]